MKWVKKNRRRGGNTLKGTGGKKGAKGEIGTTGATGTGGMGGKGGGRRGTINPWALKTAPTKGKEYPYVEKRREGKRGCRGGVRSV
jgi:hypothetical protein